MTYEVFDPRVARPLHEVSREEAVKAYDWFIENIPERISQLSRLVAKDGVSLDFTEASLSKLHDWFYEVTVEESERGNDAPSPELFSVCNDIGMYLAEMVRRVTGTVEWTLHVGSQKEVSYQRPVLTGFSVKTKNYHVDFDYLICQYAFRILRQRKPEESLFRSMYQKAIAFG